MQKLIVNFLIVILLVSLTETKLAQVVSLSRHGSRYPLNSLYDGTDNRYIWG